MVDVIRTDVTLDPDRARVLVRPFWPFEREQNLHIIGRVLELSEEEVEAELDVVMKHFEARHFDTEQVMMQRFEEVREWKFTDKELSRPRKLLIGACFTSEYALECAALFNPSLVPHPDQSDLPDGSVRFIMSLRAVGEGHVSSVVFRSGTIDADHHIELTPPSPIVTSPGRHPTARYEKDRFAEKLFEIGIEDECTQRVLDLLGDSFTLAELQKALQNLGECEPRFARTHQFTRENMLYLAMSNYDVRFGPDIPISAKVIFPHSPSETNGIEDARFVRFEEGEGKYTYYATYTAWNGRTIFPQLLSTDDFSHFRVRTLSGNVVENKGFALFPKRIGGQYAMLSRQDGENIFLMYSGSVEVWREKVPLVRPTYPWQFMKMGNCGSPLLTSEGWLVIDHAVGPMRRYCIGAFLLDRDDPTKVLGRLKEPLLEPSEEEREGYVPNVVYSCGSLIHNGKLVLPYAMSDYASRVALVDVEELLGELT